MKIEVKVEPYFDTHVVSLVNPTVGRVATIRLSELGNLISKLEAIQYEYDAIADSMSDPLQIEQQAYSEEYLAGYEAGLEEWRNR